MKYKVAPSEHKQIVVEVRDAKGNPLVLAPNAIVDLKPEVAAKVSELYPGRLLPFDGAPVKGKDDDEGAAEKKAAPTPGSNTPAVVTK